MKKFILLIALCLSSLSSFAQTREDSDGNTVYHPYFAVAQYSMGDFDVAKGSSSYGLGMVVSSISHWGAFHVGANVNFSVNAGFVDDWGCLIDFGPSVRLDISRTCFVNIPVNAVCECTFPEGETETKTDWGAKIAPALHVFATERFGLFVGPQVTFGEEDTSFGFAAGLSYAF